jgi:hypothetical protein
MMRGRSRVRNQEIAGITMNGRTGILINGETILDDLQTATRQL